MCLTSSSLLYTTPRSIEEAVDILRGASLDRLLDPVPMEGHVGAAQSVGDTQEVGRDEAVEHLADDPAEEVIHPSWLESPERIEPAGGMLGDVVSLRADRESRLRAHDTAEDDGEVSEAETVALPGGHVSEDEDVDDRILTGDLEGLSCTNEEGESGEDESYDPEESDDESGDESDESEEADGKSDEESDDEECSEDESDSDDDGFDWEELEASIRPSRAAETTRPARAIHQEEKDSEDIDEEDDEEVYYPSPTRTRWGAALPEGQDRGTNCNHAHSCANHRATVTQRASSMVDVHPTIRTLLGDQCRRCYADGCQNDNTTWINKFWLCPAHVGIANPAPRAPAEAGVAQADSDPAGVHAPKRAKISGPAAAAETAETAETARPIQGERIRETAEGWEASLTIGGVTFISGPYGGPHGRAIAYAALQRLRERSRHVSL